MCLVILLQIIDLQLQLQVEFLLVEIHYIIYKLEVNTPVHSLTLPFLKGGLTLPKISRKGGMEKLLKGRGDPKKREMLLVQVFF